MPEPRARLLTYVPPDLKEWLTKEAHHRYTSTTKLVAEVLQQWRELQERRKKDEK